MRVKPFLVLLTFLFLLTNLITVAAASPQDNNLVKVTVNLAIDNPEYFWRYPFSGKRADRLCISSMGQKLYIPKSGVGQKLEFYVPRGYQFRMTVEIQEENSALASMYFAKRGINEENNTFSVTLSAPAAQPVVVNSRGFDEIKK